MTTTMKLFQKALGSPTSGVHLKLTYRQPVKNEDLTSHSLLCPVLKNTVFLI